MPIRPSRLLLWLALALPLPLCAQNTYLRSLPSYGAQALVEPANYTKGLYTGTPEIALPIYTLQGRKLSLPIALRYDARGVKVAAIASSVGLGWALDAGGAVVRVVRGAVDAYDATGTYATGAGAEPDEFWFSVGGTAGRFALFGTEWRTIPNSRLKVTPIWTSGNMLSGFRLQDGAGTHYRFDQAESTTVSVGGVAAPAQVTAWWLSEVRAADETEAIALAYTNYSVPAVFVGYYSQWVKQVNSYVTSTPGTGTALVAGGPGLFISTPTAPCGPASPFLATSTGTDAEVTVALTNAKRLSTITSVQGSVHFTYATARADLPSGDNALTAIEVHSAFRAPANYIARFELSYDPVLLNAGTGHINRRLVLTELKQVNRDEPTQSLKTKLEYYVASPNALPASRTSKAVDAWGFHNGAPASQNLTELAVRTPSLPHALGGQLKASVQPLGARTEYTWALHEAEVSGANQAVGGLRLASSITRPNGTADAAQDVETRYFYVQGADGSGALGALSSGIEGARVRATEQVSLYNVSDQVPCGRRVHEGLAQIGFSGLAFQGVPLIEYARVAQEIGTAGQAGRSVTRYVTRSDAGAGEGTALPGAGFGMGATRRDWRRGMARLTEAFDLANMATPRRVQSSTYTFEAYDGTGGLTQNYRQRACTTAMAIAHTSGTYAVRSSATLPGTYALETGWLYAKEVNSATATQDATPVDIASRTMSVYDPVLMLPRESYRVLLPTDERDGVITRYVADLTQTGSGTDSASVALFRLNTQGLEALPVEVISYTQASGTGPKRVTGASLSVFRERSLRRTDNSLAPAALPLQSYAAKLAAPVDLVTAFPYATVTGAGAFSPSAHYGYSAAALQGQSGAIVMAYNEQGQPLETRDPVGRYASTWYGYAGTAVLASASARRSEVALQSFEMQSESDGWDMGTATYGNGFPEVTDRRSAQVTTTATVASKALPAGHYVVTLWAQGPAGTSVKVARATVEATAPLTGSAWQRVQLELRTTAAGTFVFSATSGTLRIDEVRIQPIDVAVSHADIEPLVGVRTAFDAWNYPTHTAYDSMHRATEVRDRDNHVLQRTQYYIKPN